MKTKSLFVVLSLLVVGTACSTDEPNPGDPMMPALGQQIDRAGRSAVSTALVATFSADDTVKGQMKDAYNADSNPATWVSAWSGELAANLAIYDSLDTTCGNQLAADQVAPRYSFLASVLADDQLYINSDEGTCDVYLAVEANALGIAVPDCGGRTPLVDVIDVTYSALAIGALSGVGDGVDNDTDGIYDISTFPFLLPAN